MDTNYKSWLFIGIYPTGEYYCDKRVEEHGDYKKIGCINFSDLSITKYSVEKRYDVVYNIMESEVEQYKEIGYVQLSECDQRYYFDKVAKLNKNQ